MSTKTHWIVAYRQYGEWSCTRPFAEEQKAKKHSKSYLESDEVKGLHGAILVPNSRKHIVDITFLPVELPE